MVLYSQDPYPCADVDEALISTIGILVASTADVLNHNHTNNHPIGLSYNELTISNGGGQRLRGGTSACVVGGRDDAIWLGQKNWDEDSRTKEMRGTKRRERHYRV